MNDRVAQPEFTAYIVICVRLYMVFWQNSTFVFVLSKKHQLTILPVKSRYCICFPVTVFPCTRHYIKIESLIQWNRAIMIPESFCVSLWQKVSTFTLHVMSLVDLRGAAPRKSPRGSKFFHFHAVFGKKIRLEHPLWQLAPPIPGKSWICHCVMLTYANNAKSLPTWKGRGGCV